MNIFKKIIFFSLSILLIFTISISSLAKNIGVPPKGYTEKDNIDAEKRARQKDEEIFKVLQDEKKQKKAEIADGEFYTVRVTYNAQETDYWCGPASIRQSLSFHKLESKSSQPLPNQSALAKKSGTTEKGSWTLSLRNTINEYKDIYNFSSYEAADINNCSNPLATFERRIKRALKYKESAPILLIEKKKLERYNGRKGRHYITVSGYSYDYTTGDKKIKNVDPNWRSAYGGTHWDDLDTKNGLFEAVSQADYDVGNKVMLY